MKTIIISEIGENHLGDMELAKKMIKASYDAGADIAKFQSFKADDVPDDDPEKEWFYKVEISDAQHRELKSYAESLGIEFLSAPFSLERAKFLCQDLGLKKIKIASSQIVNIALLEYIAKNCDIVYLSCGMASFDEIKKAIEILKTVKKLYLLHCVSEYPVKKENADLLVIRTLADEFKLPVGYSDHTLGVEAPIAAVSLGAQIIEKHFTLDKNLPGTDHILSADPTELKQIVERIREVEVLLGSPEKKLTSGEVENKESMRSRFSRAQK